MKWAIIVSSDSSTATASETRSTPMRVQSTGFLSDSVVTGTPRPHPAFHTRTGPGCEGGFDCLIHGQVEATPLELQDSARSFSSGRRGYGRHVQSLASPCFPHLLNSYWYVLRNGFVPRTCTVLCTFFGTWAAALQCSALRAPQLRSAEIHLSGRSTVHDT